WVPDLATYTMGGQMREITLMKVVIGTVIITFAFFDLIPELQELSFDRKYLPVGGFLSGFFGGLSGNQGALRSAFLVKSGLNTAAFAGTGSACGFIVDIIRLTIYSFILYRADFTFINKDLWGLVAVAVFSAFIGSFLGARLVKKVKINVVQYLVGTMLIIVGISLATGIL
ncbi:MAG: TSUP family transporter, partial [Dehalococcoidales bacterium]|nr:TSUP family transporter [Dehalococcoidales bacterium]